MPGPLPLHAAGAGSAFAARSVRAVAVSLLLVAGGCASTARQPRASHAPAARAQATVAGACQPPAARDAIANWCRLPAEVRAFVDDRDTCDHFRSEPWPETDSADDRARRRELIDGVRMNCAGTDARLADLRRRYAAVPEVDAILAEFDTNAE